jgi:hypothetical protein
MSSVQERFDDAFSVWGRSAPAMRADEGTNSYIRRMARVAQKKNYLAYDERVKRIDFDELPDHALPQFTEMLIDGIKRSVKRSDTVPEGVERKVVEIDGNTGQKITSFIRPDNESFVKDPEYGARACRLVTRINAPATTPLYASAYAKAAMSGGW